MSNLASKASDVYIKEVNLSQTLTQVANAVASQVVVSSKGPLGPRLWTDAQSYLDAYGNPNASVSFDQYMAMDYFKFGQAIWANRCVEADAKYGAVVILQDANGMTAIRPVPAGLGLTELTYPNWVNYVGSGETPIYVVYPSDGPGSYANNDYAISLQANNPAVPTALVASGTTSGGSMGAGTYTYAVSSVNASGAESLVSTPATVIISASPTQSSVTLNWAPVTGSVGYRIYGRASAIQNMGLLLQVGTASTSWLDDGLDVADVAKGPIVNTAKLTISTGFTLSVFNMSLSNSTPVEVFQCTLNDFTDDLGTQSETTQRINPYSQYIRVISNLAHLSTFPVLNSVTTQTTMTGGASGSAPTASTINKAWSVFSNKQLYTIDTMINAGRSTPVIQDHMDAIAQERAECVAFLDVPSGSQSRSAAIDYRNITLNLNSSYSALFTPDLLESDPTSGKLLFVPPSGMMAGLYANTTNVGQPWYSFAGLNRGLLSQVLDIRFTYEEGEFTPLYAAQINYMRKFPGQGIALWEQSTLAAQSSALQFLNVRFLCNVIKRAAYSYLLYGLQEPLDDILKMQLVTGLNGYLGGVQSGRGISDFKVICDKSNNPDILANSGILAITILITPILATRVIALTLGISKQGLVVSEATVSSMSA
jgi:phage tail sheath protein FI